MGWGRRTIHTMTLDNLEARLEEVGGLLDLGLRDDAARLVENLLEASPCRAVLAAALEVHLRNGDHQRAAAMADSLLADGERGTHELFRCASALNFADRVEEAYDVERSIPAVCNDTSLVRLYGLACKASRLGRQSEALCHLLACFRFHNIEGWDAFRKVFIDSELTGLWSEVPSMDLPLRLAMRFSNIPFDEILAMNAPGTGPRCLDPLDLRTMPGHFRQLLQPAHSTCFEVGPRQEAANPALFDEFLRWQEGIAGGRLEAFRGLADRIRERVIAEQLDFALFQAARGRLASARNHVVCHLERVPGASIDDIPPHPLLDPLVEELRAQEEESAEDFRYLISWKCRAEPERFIFDIHPGMSPRNRDSGYASLALGCMHHQLGNSHAAIEHWRECARKWPNDDAPVMNAAMLLSGEERWDEADTLINRLPDHCMESTLWKSACSAIRERRSFTISSRIFTAPVIPTPTFGGLYSGADEEYLIERRQFTPVTH
jgi:tetratricopeptide (TPR) repeat protein